MDDLLRRLDLASAALAPAPNMGQDDQPPPATASAAEEPALGHRVQTFLANIEPFEGYAPGSEAEDCLQLFAARVPWDDDARSELRICYSAILDEFESHDFAAFSGCVKSCLKFWAKQAEAISGGLGAPDVSGHPPKRASS